MEKMDIMADISHEFRTPLNAIIGFSELLIKGDYSKGKQHQFLNNISLSGKHLLELVNDLIDMSQNSEGKISLHYEKFEITKAIKEIVDVLSPLALKKDIIIKTDLQKTLIEADLRKFKQILYNLIHNSIKYTAGNGSITVKAHIRNNSLRVEIKDTGVGIPVKNGDKIFERFYRASSTCYETQEGTGLGLAISKAFIEAHGGNIYFKSDESHGTKFWFNIPISKKEINRDNYLALNCSN